MSELLLFSSFAFLFFLSHNTKVQMKLKRVARLSSLYILSVRRRRGKKNVQLVAGWTSSDVARRGEIRRNIGGEIRSAPLSPQQQVEILHHQGFLSRALLLQLRSFVLMKKKLSPKLLSPRRTASFGVQMFDHYNWFIRFKRCSRVHEDEVCEGEKNNKRGLGRFDVSERRNNHCLPSFPAHRILPGGRR